LLAYRKHQTKWSPATTLKNTVIENIVHAKVFIPFTEIGVQYAFDRPNDGKILTGNFSQAQP
jgi:hypothetical protein